MVRVFTRRRAGRARDQARLYYNRERARSLHFHPPLLNRTHLFGIPLPVGSFTAAMLNAPITFQTRFTFLGGAVNGLVFEYGNATTAVAAWFEGNTIKFRAGDAAANDRALATYDNGSAWAVGRKHRFTFACNPGTGSIRFWCDGDELARDTAANGQLPNGWAANSAGGFLVASGALPADVTQVGIPATAIATEFLSAYAGQIPRGFTG